VYKDAFHENKLSEEQFRIIKILSEELETFLSALSNPSALREA